MFSDHSCRLSMTGAIDWSSDIELTKQQINTCCDHRQPNHLQHGRYE